MIPLLAVAGLAWPLAAQEAAQGESAPEAPAAAAPGAPAAPPQPVTVAEHGDWQVMCVEGSSECGMVQTVNGESGEPLFRVEVFKLGAEQQGAAAMRFSTPIGVMLQRGIGLRIDAGEPVAAPFVYCVPNSCIAQVTLREQDVNRFKRGAAAQLTVFSVQRPDAAVNGELSLMGFTRSYDELN